MFESITVNLNKAINEDDEAIGRELIYEGRELERKSEELRIKAEKILSELEEYKNVRIRLKIG